jgi:cell division septation protein DedD
MRVLKALCCAAAITVALAPSARADEWNKKTILTFSGPVQIPGATLPAGSYVFKLADIPGNRHVVQVFDKDEKKIYTTMLAIPNERLEPADQPVVLFAERASGSPQAVKVWFYPGDRVGNEFVYPKSQAMRIAKETRQSVLAMNDDTSSPGTAGEIPNSMRTAELGRFDENGKWVSDNRRVAVNGNTSTTTAQSTTAAAAQPTTAQPTTAQPTTAEQARPTTARPTTAPAPTTARATTAQPTTADRAAGTSGARATRQSLPRTAGSLALFELLSGLSLASAWGVRRFRR